MHPFKIKLVVSLALALGFLGLTLGLLGALTPVSQAKPLLTNISGTVTTHTTWSVISSPFILIDNVTISSGITLTVEPGVVVKGQLNKELKVLGHLEAIGTANQPITFTSATDTAGNQWMGLIFDGGSGHLRHTTVRYGGNNHISCCVGSNILANNNSQLLIESSNILTTAIGGGGSHGLYIDNSQLVLSDTVVAYNRSLFDQGLYAVGANSVITVTGSTFRNNGGNGFYAEAAKVISVTHTNFLTNGSRGFVAASANFITVTNSLFQNNAGGLYTASGIPAWLPNNTFIGNGAQPVRTDAGNLPVLLSTAVFSGNTSEQLLTEGTINQNVTFFDSPGLSSIEFEDDLTVATGVTLTVKPGVVVKGQLFKALNVSGHLEAIGTVGQPITFTSATDTAGSPWRGLIFFGGATGHLRYTTVRYGGNRNIGNRDASNIVSVNSQLLIESSKILTAAGGIANYGLYINSSQLVLSDTLVAYNSPNSWDYGLHVVGANSVITVTDSCIINNGGDGIHLANLSSPNFSMRDSDISGNGYGLGNLSGITAMARFNWWGHPTGPTHASNPTGQGQTVSDDVDFSNWQVEPICSSLLRISKIAPDTAVVGEPFTYTLNIRNRGGTTATNVVITDAVPSGLSDIQPLDGGQLVGQVVKWILPQLPAKSITSVRFIVTPTTSRILPLVNSKYRVSADDGSTATGIIPFKTTVVNAGSGTFDPGAKNGQANTLAIALADVDGDGDLDAIDANGSPNQIWINNGSGTFDSGQTLSSTLEGQAVALDDLNDDGSPDIIVGNDGDNQIWLNNGSGSFSLDYTLSSSNTQAIALGDLDGDGSTDAFIGNDDGNQVWLNNGSSMLNLDQSQPFSGGNSQAVVLGDLDSDGDLDVFVGAGSGQANQVWLNDGTGVFNPSAQTLSISNTQAVALGDLNGDGFSDVLLGNGQGQANQVWLNDGAGIFTLTYSFGLSNTQAVALGDIDADEDLDAIIGNGNEQGNEVWLNNGSGIFVNTGQTLALSNTYGIALGDLDGDGDLDIYVANGGPEGAPNQVFFNRNRQTLTVDPNGETIIDVTQGLTTIVVIPAGVLTQATTFTFTTLLEPSPPTPNNLSFANRAFELNASRQGLPITNPFTGPITITIHYNPAGVNNPGKLRIYYRNESGQWLDAATTCPVTSTYHHVPNYVRVAICHLTEFGLFEANNAPILNPIGPQLVAEGTLLTFTVTATDTDIPLDSLTFGLDSNAPNGTGISATTGVFTWTPSEAQGPDLYTVTALVTDDGNPVLTDSLALTITVNEVNTAPSFDPITPLTVTQGSPLTFTITATDADLPANILSFGLTTDAPTGATIVDTNLFTWTPTNVQSEGLYSVTVVVSDDGVPVLTDSQLVTITVSEASGAGNVYLPIILKDNP